MHDDSEHHGKFVRRENICAIADTKRKDACQGDSGGPLITNTRDVYKTSQSMQSTSLKLLFSMFKLELSAGAEVAAVRTFQGFTLKSDISSDG